MDELRKKVFIYLLLLQHVSILEQILERLKRAIENCKLEPFPTVNDIE